MRRIITLTTLTVLTLALIATTTPAQAFTMLQLIRCGDTHFEDGAYGNYYGMTYHGTNAVCAGDDLDLGGISVVANQYLHVYLRGALADPFCLYEIYWVPVGGNPIDSADPSGDGTRIRIGHVMTDCNGNANNLVRDMSVPADVFTAPPVDFVSLVGDRGAGTFLFYSRGPYGDTDTGTCRPANWNTSDGTPAGTFNNPDLWGGNTNMFDGVQFLSGYSTP